MLKIEVRIISKEIIKPSSPTIHNHEPYKLCLFDQLTPTTYAPLILFYPKTTKANLDATQLSSHLKKALSETLTRLYPFSGRLKDNSFIERFDEGVLFFEAHVNCKLSEFFEDPKIESLNQFLPRQPFSNESYSEDVPLIAFQVSVFSCGGIALGACMSHKIGDGGAGSTFFNVWSGVSRGESCDFETLLRNLTKASAVFPPRQDLPDKYATQRGRVWFQEGNFITRRFVFDAKAIETLRNKMSNEEGKSMTTSSRIQALSCFIWKHFMATSRAISTSPRPCYIRFAMNLRTRTVPRLDGAIGNVYLTADVLANSDRDMELHELANLMSAAVSNLDNQDFLTSIQGDEGFQAICEGLKLKEDMLAKENPDKLIISSWCKFGFEDLNFGFGEPVWLGLFGKSGPEYVNSAILAETKGNKGFELWLTLDEKRMAILEHDPEFLAYASSNPKIPFKPA